MKGEYHESGGGDLVNVGGTGVVRNTSRQRLLDRHGVEEVGSNPNWSSLVTCFGTWVMVSEYLSHVSGRYTLTRDRETFVGL